MAAPSNRDMISRQLHLGETVERKGIQRRLAAILAADVVGYSRLMGADEVGTLTMLKAHRRELIDPAIAGHSGRIVKTTGDGMLVEFGSVVDAVGCALAVQRAMSSRNAAVPEDRRIIFRVGINVGASSSMVMTFSATASISLPGCRRCASQAACASPARLTIRSGISCLSPSLISASKPSRTFPGRLAFSASARSRSRRFRKRNCCKPR